MRTAHAVTDIDSERYKKLDTRTFECGFGKLFWWRQDVLVQQGGVGEITPNSREDFPTIIASTPPSARQRKIVIAVIALLALGIVVAIPFAGVQGPRIDAFIPVLQTVMCVADLITASLLLAQYSIQPQRALLVLAGGYICSGMFAFLQTLAFPGAYTPTGSSVARTMHLGFLCSGTPLSRWRSSPTHF